MALDIRADVECSLGTLISGNFADNYLQSNGLIRTRGEVVLSGTQTPTVGTTVTFTYTKNGTEYTLPRVLRVLSSFADPFRRTTTVQLGCKLTYLENRKPPVENPNGRDENNVSCAVYDRAMLPISASYIFEHCATALDLTTDTIPLTNYFSVEEFDLTAGYIEVMSALLQSEGYAGYLDSNEVLRFVDLSDEGGTGPLITSEEVIDIGPIGTGELPGESVVVRYSTERLLPPEELTDDEVLSGRWESEEVTGSPVPVSVSYTNSQGQTVTETSTFIPYTYTASRYDIWDRKIEQLTVSTRSSAEVNGSWANDAASVGRSWNVPAARYTVESFTYKRGARAASTVDLSEAASSGTATSDLKSSLVAASDARTDAASTCKAERPDDYGQINRQTSKTVVSELEIAGGVGIDSYISGDGVLVSFSTVANQTQSLTEVDYTHGGGGDVVKTVVKRFQNFSSTLPGQQALADRAQLVEAGNSNQIDALVADGSALVYQGAEVTSTSSRDFGLQKRPSASERTATSYSKRRVTESEAELEWVTGSTDSTAVIEFTLPYAPDDKISWTQAGGYTSTPSDAAEKALRYGRIQNGLLLGNRNGLSLQLTPEQLPKRPFDPLYVEADGIVGSYRVNGSSWAFDANGIVASNDALLYGAVSATSGANLSTSWVPLAPNTSSLPSPYTSSQGTADSETGVTYSSVISPTVILKPYNEKVKVDARTSSTITIVEIPYDLDLGTESVAVVTRSKVNAGSALIAAGTSFSATGKAAGLLYTRALAAAAAGFTSTGYSAGSVRDYAIGTNAGTFTATGQSARLLYGRAPMPLSAGSFSSTGQSITFFKGSTLQSSPGSFSLTGGNSNGVYTRSLAANAGSISLTGQSAALNVSVSDPDFADVQLLLHGEGTNGATSTTDSSNNGLTLTFTGNAQISTAQKKFGYASIDFTNGSGTVRYPASSGDELDVASNTPYTLEFWIYITSAYTSTQTSSSAYAIWESVGSSSYRHSVNLSGDGSGNAVFRWSRNFSSTGAFNHQTTLSTGQWYHFALVRQTDNNIYMYVDGTKSTSYGTSNSLLDNASFWSIGPRQTTNNQFYMDEVRFTVGVARYTSSFTVPSDPYPDS